MRLLLHIGHGKTGSSFLQSWLACNADRLQSRCGLLMPGDTAAARAGHFSMGNGDRMESLLQQSAAEQSRWLQQRCEHALAVNGLLFSREGWARRFPDLVDPMLRLADAWGVERIELLLFVRDPLDHACSVYSQVVKRHGYAGSIDAWLEVYDFTARLLACLRCVAAHADRLQLRVEHYGQQRQRLIPVVGDWLQLDAEADWCEPPVQRVNRSLTQEELQLMRWLNGTASRERSARIGELLVNRLPDLPAAVLQPAPAAVDRFLDHWSETVNQINALLPLEDGLRLEPRSQQKQQLQASAPGSAITLLPEQLECLRLGISGPVHSAAEGPEG